MEHDDDQSRRPAPGFRFYPTEEELVLFYLPTQLHGQRHDLHRVIPVVNIYQHEPSDLPMIAGELCREDTEQWFFFVPRQEREAQGGRPTRTTASGYWKATGSPGYVYSSDHKVIGVKKTMVFYRGRPPSGKKTKWKMNEYRAIKEELDNTNTFSVPKLLHELSLCRVYVVSGSVRAFDRRPLMGLLETTQKTFVSETNRSTDHGDASSSQNNIKTEKATSSSECPYDPNEDEMVEMANELLPQGVWEDLLDF